MHIAQYLSETLLLVSGQCELLTSPSTTYSNEVYSITHCTQLPLPLALRAPVPEFPEAEGHVLDLSLLPADKLEGADSKMNSLGRSQGKTS